CSSDIHDWGSPWADSFKTFKTRLLEHKYTRIRNADVSREPCGEPPVGDNILRFHDKLASCAWYTCAGCYQKDNKPMKIFRGFHHPGIADACALTIGNFDGVHRGHQAMLALLNSEAAHRGVESCVLTFEPH